MRLHPRLLSSLARITNMMDTGILDSVPFSNRGRIAVNVNDYFLKLLIIKHWHHGGIVD